MIRKILLGLVVLIAVIAAGLWWFTRPLPVLTITTWAGTYGQAQDRAMMRPFAAARRVDTRLALWDGDLETIARAVRTKNYDGDVYDLELPQAVKACRQGLLEKIDAERLPRSTNGVAAVRDFVPGAIGPCWVGSVVYSHVIAVAPHTFPVTPTKLTAFFDTKTFPGRRVLLRASPKFNLEMALLADGVAPDKIYAALATPQGQTRAFAKLKTLNPLWADNSQDAMNLLRTGGAVMAQVLNGSLFDAQQAHGFSPDVIWDRQLYELDVFAIPAGDPRKNRALDFIRFATGTEPLAQVASWLPYGPARRSAWGKVGNNPALKIAMTPFQPTTHFATAFAIDDGWWQDHLATLTPRWLAFVQGANTQSRN